MTDGLADIVAQLERKKAAIEKALEALKEVDEGEAPAPKTGAKRKGGMTLAGRKRLAENMKKRWALKRAAAGVKKVGRKKRAAKKAA